MRTAITIAALAHTAKLYPELLTREFVIFSSVLITVAFVQDIVSLYKKGV